MIERGLKLRTCRAVPRMEGGVFFKEVRMEGGRGSGGKASHTRTFPDLVPPPPRGAIKSPFISNFESPMAFCKKWLKYPLCKSVTCYFYLLSYSEIWFEILTFDRNMKWLWLRGRKDLGLQLLEVKTQLAISMWRTFYMIQPWKMETLNEETACSWWVFQTVIYRASIIFLSWPVKLNNMFLGFFS